MTKNKLSGRVIPFLILFLFLLIPFTLAIDECKSHQPSDKIPCYIFLNYNSTCSDLTVSFYNASSLLVTKSMEQYSPFICSVNFTYSSVGTYNFNYSTRDSGAIVVEDGTTMIYLLYFGLAVIALLTMWAFKTQDQRVFLINGLLMLVMGLYIWINGFGVYNDMGSKMVATVIFGIGMYFTFMASMSMVDGD